MEIKFPKLAELAQVRTPEEERLVEEKWIKKVDTDWSPPDNFFTKTAGAIAAGLKANSKSLKQAMSRLNFYINRAGSNLSDKDKARLEAAKDKLHNLYK